MVERDFLVFYYADDGNNGTVVRLACPPHDPPRGAVLESLLARAIQEQVDLPEEPLICGAVELTQAGWATGHYREAVIGGDSRVCSLECTGGEWRFVG